MKAWRIASFSAARSRIRPSWIVFSIESIGAILPTHQPSSVPRRAILKGATLRVAAGQLV